MPRSASHALSLVLAVALSGCGQKGGNQAFMASGEVIAMGGGAGGAANACMTCHGLKGEGDGARVPRLAALDAGYLHRQLDDYVNGRREHPEMRTIARRLDGGDRAKVSAYYAQLDAPAQSLPQVSALYQVRCASCHGSRGQGVGPANPPLAGLSPEYIEAQLEAWRTGRRRGEGGDVMLRVSRELTPQQIRHLAGLAAEPGLPAPARLHPMPGASR